MTADPDHPLHGRRVLVTGASGFVGRRLVERLVTECGADVVAMAHTLAGAARLSDIGCRAIAGDVLDQQAVDHAVDGCDTVFHCAIGTTGSKRHRILVNREGTRRVLTAAGKAGVRRAVHLSTFMVYGRTSTGELTEAWPRRRFGEHYADSKLAAEQIAMDLAASGRSPVVVVQPTIVYGPHAGVWGKQVLDRLRGGDLVLVDDGAGICNNVYVDDLASALLLAATADGAIGEAFLISSGETVTWREFYEQLAPLAGAEDMTSRRADQALADWQRSRAEQPRLAGELLRLARNRESSLAGLRRTREVDAVRDAVSRMAPDALHGWLRKRFPTAIPGSATPTPHYPKHAPALLTPQEIDFFASRTVVHIDKAARILGYQPAFTLAAGMAPTLAWLSGLNS